MRRSRRNPYLRPSRYGKQLAGKDLGGEDFTYTDLSGADLRGADLSVAELQGANLSGADLSGAKLVNAFLRAADLSGANLTGADLTDAHLHEVNFSGANLTDANLESTSLDTANLTGVDLSRAKNVPRVGWLTEHYPLPEPTSAAFKHWFGESVVVGDDRKPVVVYHGTDRGGFTKFDPKAIDHHHNGFYFTNSLRVAETYTTRERPPRRPDPAVEPGQGVGIYRLYIRLVNPMVVEGDENEWNELDDARAPGLRKTYELAAWARRHGHDGVIFRDIIDSGGKGPELAPAADVYVVFDPKAIKSATANSGAYDPDDADIRHNPRRPRRR